jgi:hypothetical protein
MDHAYIRERNIPDLYLLGELSSEERASFEQHYFDCEECVRALELSRSFQAGMRDAPLLGARRDGSSRWRMAVAFAAGVLLTIAPALWLARPGMTVEQMVAAEQEKKAALRRELSRLPAPASLDLYPLNTPRGKAATPRIPLPATPRLMVFLLDQEPDPALRNYRAWLLDGNGQLVWEQSGVEPGARSTFAIGVRSELLHLGNYTLSLEGTGVNGRQIPLATYRFTVESKER